MIKRLEERSTRAEHSRRRVIIAGFCAVVFPLQWARAAPAQRIVSIGSAVTETIFALGQGHRVIAVDTTSNYPPEAKALPNVGYMRALSSEGVLAMDPDLILASAGSGPPEVMATLSQSRVPVVTVTDAPGLAGIVERTKAIAATLGVTEKGSQLVARIERQFAAIKQAIQTAGNYPRVLFILSMSNGRLIVAGENSSAATIIALAGGENAISGFSGFKPANDEAILAARPDVVLMMANTNSTIGADELFALPAFQTAPAAKDRRLIKMDGPYLLGFGPRAASAVRELALALHPGLVLPQLP